MVEALVTLSIIIILLAIGMVAVIRYRDHLRITELDNMARSIYMAAQNRVVLLDNDRRFQSNGFLCRVCGGKLRRGFYYFG